MILTLSTLSFGASLCCMQGPPPPDQPTPAAPPSVTALQTAAGEWFAAKIRYDNSATRAERTAAKALLQPARPALDNAMADFEVASGHSLLVDAEALAATFADVFAPAEHPATVSTITLHDKPEVPRAQLVPAGYDGSRSYPIILLMTGRAERGDAEAVQRYLKATWSEAARREQMLIIAPVLPVDLDLDGPDAPEPNATGPATANNPERADPTDDENVRAKRIGSALRPLGECWQQLHAARDRVVLDCGRGASAFGLRLVSMFPDRFAGVVLRWPVLDKGLRIEALQGIPVLLVRCPATAAACNQLRAELHAQTPGSCQVLTPPTAYPFAAETGIGEWARQQRSDTMARRVVVAPSHDRFHQNRWVRIDKADPVGQAPWDDAPRIVAEADLANNRITVTTRGVQSFTLLVGPALVDVRNFTLNVNGREQQVKLQPSLRFLLENMQMRSDPGYLFTARHQVTVL